MRWILSVRLISTNCDSADRSGINAMGTNELETIDRLTEILRESILVPCTACQYCMPCPEGVNIPGNFAILNNVHAEKNAVRQFLVKRSYRKLASNKKELDVDKSNGKAIMCTECGACLPKCPQSIQISEELKRVEAVVRHGKKADKVLAGSA